MDIEQVKLKIINDFRDKAPAEFIKSIIDKLIIEDCIKDHLYILTIDNPNYMDNIYRIITININYQKQKNERNLNISKFFYSYCDNKDILDNIYQFYNEKK
jgi:hypothetical protein